MKIYNHKIEALFPFQFVFLGYVGIVASIYFLIILNFWGLPLILASLFVSFSFSGIQIDFDKDTYNEYLGLFLLKFGKWKTLPEIQYVTVFNDHYVQEMHVASISGTQTVEDVKINLVITKSSFISIGKFKNKTSALETGHLLASNLKTKLLNYTSAEPEWMRV
jgi:hypothetical protein